MAVFAALAVVLLTFVLGSSDEFMNNPYNKRIRVESEYISRGSIITSDGVVIAENVSGGEGDGEIREYPYGRMFSHLAGFREGGGMGLERSESFSMSNSHEFLFARIAHDITGNKSRGDNVITTVSFELQKAAYEALGDRRGAVVVMEADSGRVLAMVSKPDFNPATVGDDWAEITEDSSSSVFVNRALNGLYPPGSVFKIVTALEYIRENKKPSKYKYDCTGGIDREDGTVLHCYGGEVHGELDLTSAFAKSCNTAFADIGSSLNREKWKKTAGELLFNTDLSQVLSMSGSSYLLGASDTVGKAMDTAIGQGDTTVTPMHMCMIAAGIKNDGVVMKPVLVDRIQSADKTWQKGRSTSRFETIMTSKEAEKLRELMDATVSGGTARKLQSELYTAGGKTGSAEYGSVKGASHGWFVGYASDGKKKDIAVAVIVEDGNTGAASAVPVTKAVFDVYFGE